MGVSNGSSTKTRFRVGGLVVAGAVLVVVTALCGCLTLPSEQSAPEGVRKAGEKLQLRERRHILPGFSSTPPPPEAAVTSSQCDDITDGGPVAGGDCVTAEVQCGE